MPYTKEQIATVVHELLSWDAVDEEVMPVQNLCDAAANIIDQLEARIAEFQAIGREYVTENDKLVEDLAADLEKANARIAKLRLALEEIRTCKETTMLSDDVFNRVEHWWSTLEGQVPKKEDYLAICAEVRPLRRDAAKWRELESKSKQALAAYKALDLSRPSLREQNAALRAQLDEAVRVLEATDKEGDFEYDSTICAKFDCKEIAPCCHMQARDLLALLAILTRQTGAK